MITITYKPKPEEKKILTELEEIEKVVFLHDSYHDRKDILENTEVLITLFPNKELSEDELSLLSNSKRLRIVQCILSGTDHIKKDWFPNSLVLGNSGAYSSIIVEHVFAFILFWSKNLLVNYQKLKQGVYDQNTGNILLNGKNIGIIGLGGIGREVARVAKAFNMKVLAINTTGKTDSQYVDEIYTLEKLNYVLVNSDVVVIALPLNDKTENLINHDNLSIMKKNAILVNVGRGPIINQRDLYYFLKDNPDFKCALDVWWSEPAFNQEFKLDYPFFELPNFWGSPHNSALTPETFSIRTKYLVENLKLRIINMREGEKQDVQQSICRE
ncbi:MAG: NAD(P)-dependent oxidoreductase [Candidatus Calescibacterium sp.]|nr:NAD(P)-binding domain-containing protein [Candidatus Calescibacterium sp.]MDW8132867.1 NAD(P)-dependent oxidoreductase [Candidatus Calescibacterium sp.]